MSSCVVKVHNKIKTIGTTSTTTSTATTTKSRTEIAEIIWIITIIGKYQKYKKIASSVLYISAKIPWIVIIYEPAISPHIQPITTAKLSKLQMEKIDSIFYQEITDKQALACTQIYSYLWKRKPYTGKYQLSGWKVHRLRSNRNSYCNKMESMLGHTDLSSKSISDMTGNIQSRLCSLNARKVDHVIAAC